MLPINPPMTQSQAWDRWNASTKLPGYSEGATRARHAKAAAMRRKVKWLGIRFEPRDVWVGWYWDRRDDGTHHYVCVLPMVVAHWVYAAPVRRKA